MLLSVPNKDQKQGIKAKALQEEIQVSCRPLWPGRMTWGIPSSFGLALKKAIGRRGNPC